jgi:hypothetical protein
MCNPRRIRVRASRRLTESWDQEVRRQVTLHGQAVGRACVREGMGETLGRPVLVALDRVLDELDGWEPVDSGYRHEVDGGYVLYHADTGELEVVAELRTDVQAAGEATVTVQGAVQETLDVEGVGRYYDDGWGGLTADTARRDAEAHAQHELERAAAERIARTRAELEEGTADDLLAQAQEAAEAELAAATAARSAQLDQDAVQRLAAVGVQARRLFNQALAQAYRDAILAYARSRQAQGLRVSETGGVLDIEFEMEA